MLRLDGSQSSVSPQTPRLGTALQKRSASGYKAQGIILSTGHFDKAQPLAFVWHWGATMQTQTANAAKEDLRSASPSEPIFQRVWPPALVVFGFELSAAWIGLLVYGFVSLIAHAV